MYEYTKLVIYKTSRILSFISLTADNVAAYFYYQKTAEALN